MTREELGNRLAAAKDLRAAITARADWKCEVCGAEYAWGLAPAPGTRKLYFHPLGDPDFSNPDRWIVLCDECRSSAGSPRRRESSQQELDFGGAA